MGPDLFSDLRALFTDLDGTLTTNGKVRASTYQALEDLTENGLPVVIVTGRPAGYAEALARTWPVRAVVAENGGVRFVPGARGRLLKRYAVPRASLPALRKRMLADAARVARRVPGARLSMDAGATEVNLALDWNEGVHLPESAARRLEVLLRERGYRAVRSSVHVNFWPPRFDKLTACRRVIREALGADPRDLSPYLYVGDALNDAPLFGGFPRSVGVANVRKVWEELPHKPVQVARHPEGRGFEEVAARILRARRGRVAGARS